MDQIKPAVNFSLYGEAMAMHAVEILHKCF